MADEPVAQEQEPKWEQPPEPQPELTSSVLREVGRELGYTDEDFSQFADDKQLARALYQSADQYGQYRQQVEPLAQLGQKFAPYADKLSDFDKWLQSQKEAEAPKEPETPAFDWQVMERDPSWDSASPDDPLNFAAAKAKSAEYDRWQKQTQERLLREFPQLAQRAVEPILSEREKRLQERIEQLEGRFNETVKSQAELAEQSQVQAWLQANAKEFYAHDEQGQIVMQQGRPLATDYGKQAWEAYQWAKGLRGPDGNPLPIEQATQIAMARVPRPSGNGKPPTPPEPPPQRFMDSLSEAERHPERRDAVADHSAPPSMYPDEEDQFEAATRQAAKELGVSLSR